MKLEGGEEINQEGADDTTYRHRTRARPEEERRQESASNNNTRRQLVVVVQLETNTKLLRTEKMAAAYSDQVDGPGCKRCVGRWSKYSTGKGNKEKNNNKSWGCGECKCAESDIGRRNWTVCG